MVKDRYRERYPKYHGIIFFITYYLNPPFTVFEVQNRKKWFEPRSGHMWENQVLLTDDQLVLPGFFGFRPLLMNDRLDISEIFLKGP